MKPSISVIISTYNSEKWLHKVLLGFSVQTFQDFEIIVADDGSGPATKEVITNTQKYFKRSIKHAWHPDNGFQKTIILNKAILLSEAEYLLFTDGDCIPRKDFVANHFKFKQKGFFLSGGYFKLPQETSLLINDEAILSNDCFRISWLINKGLKLSFKCTKLSQWTWFAVFMNWVTPTKRTWNGHNSSGFKADILAVNGFNNLMQYGGEDRELGERLFNYGLVSKQIRYYAICLHLYHERTWDKPESWQKNSKIRAFNLKHNVTFIENGINKLT